MAASPQDATGCLTSTNHQAKAQGSGNGLQHSNDTHRLSRDILMKHSQLYEFTHPQGTTNIQRDYNAFIDGIFHFVLLTGNFFIAAVQTVRRKLKLWQNLLTHQVEI